MQWGSPRTLAHAGLAAYAHCYKDLAFILGVLRSRAFWVDMVLGSNKVWLPAKVAMYSLVPPEYWGLWCSCVSFGWGIVLATIVSDAN